MQFEYCIFMMQFYLKTIDFFLIKILEEITSNLTCKKSPLACSKSQAQQTQLKGSNYNIINNAKDQGDGEGGEEGTH